ncbi:nucleotidyltransferase domain-containing protein [Deinococcus oregonensis]|uniref:Nucleotidyltransferase domain-containing protein n=1 Tax=Deinococcus oregonensis TaxID=1805970 RepID=A0ABV6B3A6_9DEIO
MDSLTVAAQSLTDVLGSALERGRTTGIFVLSLGGPGSVPALADLDVPELHLDLLPGTPTEAALIGLGYTRQPDGGFVHPGGWRVVVAEEGTAWATDQAVLRDLLQDAPAAAYRYRAAFVQAGRRHADALLLPAAYAHHAQTVGFAPALFAAQTLAPLDLAWMLAGGWALDAWHGTVTRPHEDIDIIVPRQRQDTLREALVAGGWRLDACRDGGYHAWTAPIQAPDHQAHARHPELPHAQLLDVLLTDIDDQTWIYRRDPRVTLPLAQARLRGAHGLPHLAPQVVLLFKSRTANRDPRGKDQRDFARTLPTLNAEARAWLVGALRLTSPGHEWLAALEGARP